MLSWEYIINEFDSFDFLKADNVVLDTDSIYYYASKWGRFKRYRVIGTLFVIGISKVEYNYNNKFCITEIYVDNEDSFEYLDFEEFFDRLPEYIKLKFIFHLDLFKNI